VFRDRNYKKIKDKNRPKNSKTNQYSRRGKENGAQPKLVLRLYLPFWIPIFTLVLGMKRAENFPKLTTDTYSHIQGV